MARRPSTQTLEAEHDAISEVLQQEVGKEASDLSEALDFVGGITGTDVKIILYQVSKAGKWGYIREMKPPVDVEELAQDLRENYGPGDYQFRVMSGGKIRANRPFSIAAPKTAPAGMGGNSTDMTRLLLEMSDKARGEQGNMFQMMMAMMQNSSQQQMAAMQQSSQMMMTLVTAMMANKEDPTSSMVKVAETMKMLNPPQEKSNFKEMLENMTMLKTLAGDGGGAMEEGGLMGLAKQFLPALGGLATEVMKNGGGNNGQQMQVLPTPAPRVLDTGAGYGALSGPVGASVAGPPTPGAAPQVQTNPVVAAIRDDVLYLMRKPHDTELAADVIIASLDAAKIGEEEFNALAMDVLSAGDQWPQKVAQYGIDVTGRELWFSSVVTILANHYGATGDNGSDDGGERGEGGAGDPQNNVSLGELRRAQSAGS